MDKLGPEPALADSAGRRLLSDQQLIVMFGPRIRRLARRFVCDHLPSLQMVDLEANAIAAMLRAAERYRYGAEIKVPFGAYVQRRLVGVMQDTLRQEARQAKRNHKARAERGKMTGVDALVGQDRGPAIAADTAMLRKLIRSAMGASLSDRQHRAVRLLYIDHLTLKQAGVLLHVGESRMCQIHAQLLGKLRAHLKLCGIVTTSGMFDN